MAQKFEELARVTEDMRRKTEKLKETVVNYHEFNIELKKPRNERKKDFLK